MSKQQAVQRTRQVRARNRAPVRRVPPAASAFGRHSGVIFSFPYDRLTLYLILGGLAIIVVGYLLLATSMTDDPAGNAGVWNNALAVTWAPVVLVIGYCVAIPIALMRRHSSRQEGTDQE